MVKNIIFLLIMISVVGLLYLLSSKKFIPFPPDETHMSITEESMCFECHSEEGEYPRKKEHPPKEQCFKCHEVMKPGESSGND